MNYISSLSDNELYKEKTKLLIEQFNSYGVNGTLTIGETFADIVGLEVSLRVLKKHTQRESDLKHFFIHHAVCCREKSRPEKIELQKATDPHPPEINRVNGAYSVNEDFYKLFNLKPGDKMYIDPSQRFNLM